MEALPNRISQILCWSERQGPSNILDQTSHGEVLTATCMRTPDGCGSRRKLDHSSGWEYFRLR